ncbi:MAG: sugar transferase [Eggerthella lenta]
MRDSGPAGPSIVLCIAIRLESPGCPIYSQKRVGRIGRSGEVRTFDMYKFRSMHKDADERLAELAELNEADGRCSRSRTTRA